MNLIELANITKIYHERGALKTPALNGVSLSIAPGEFMCLSGPSGSGKTTLLNIMGALDKPTSGRIIFEEKDITGISITLLADFRLNKIGFVFQAYNLFNSLSAMENVEYVMLLQGQAGGRRKERAAELLRRVGLGDYLNKRPNQLSGGQQQRVAVARALAANPRVILADEPTANLDSAAAAGLIDLMRELNKQPGMTFIFSTHDKLVMDKADRVVTLKDGRIL